MFKWQKAILCITFSFALVFTAIGYAQISDDLKLLGQAIVSPVYDELVITNVVAVSGTTVSSQTASRIAPTNVSSTITGKAGDKIVYKITAFNYSETERYVYTGITCSSEFGSVFNKLSISVYKDQTLSQMLHNNTSAKYTEGTPVNPGEQIVFYATYTLMRDITAGEIWINYNFKPIIYTVTYLDNNETYAVDCITDNSVEYKVEKTAPTSKENLSFAGWMNPNAVIVNSCPAYNENDYTLTAKWENVYMIIFADADGSVIYQEKITSSSTKLSDEGQAIVDAKLAELKEKNTEEFVTVEWSSYNISNPNGDITVYAVYTYSGYLNLEPVPGPNGGVEYYKVLAVDDLPKTVIVPGTVGGKPVKVIERITNVDGESDWDNYEKNVKKIVIGEGVEVLGWNALAWTPELEEVYLPSTITQMDKNVFSRNDLFGNDKKKITINFNGTKAQWKAIVNNSNKDWDGGLKSGTKVQCTDGYFEINTWGSWKEY